jgi:heme-degrading monooxygenase HmoA
MFARLQTINQPAAKLDELSRLAQEQLASAPELPGFRGFYYLIDRDNGKGLVISLWESEEDLRQLEANNASVREHVRAEARLESPTAEVFEVAVHASRQTSP